VIDAFAARDYHLARRAGGFSGLLTSHRFWLEKFCGGAGMLRQKLSLRWVLAVLFALFSFGELLAAPHPDPAHPIPLLVSKGVALRVVLDENVSVKRVGQPVRGKLAEPVYAYDRVVVPAGSEVLGRIARLSPITRRQRILDAMHGDFLPPHAVEVEFDTLVLKDGTRVPLETAASPGIARLVHLESGAPKQKKESLIHQASQRAREQVDAAWHTAVADVKQPEKGKRIKAWMWHQFPFHHQQLASGAVFDAVLESPLDFGRVDVPAQELAKLGSAPAPGSVVYANLETALDSGTARWGMPVAAVLSEPLYSSDGRLILPEGSSLRGEVVEAQAARRLHRNGKLRIVFRQVDLPSGASFRVDSALEGLDVAQGANLSLDSESGTSVKEPRHRYFAPALSVALTASNVAPDSEHGRTGGGDASNQSASGGIGFGFLGMLMGLAPQPVSAGFSVFGTSRMVYSRFLARGENIVFPAGTAMEIRFGSHVQANPSRSRAAATPLPASPSAPPAKR
jgi:hypothetical protein